MFTIGVFAIITKNKQVLLSHRRDMDVWNLPGGKVEAGESPQEALLREVTEETGLQVEVRKLTALNAKPKQNELVLTYKCKVLSGKIKKSNEADKHDWFNLSDIPLNIVPKQLERIINFYKQPNKVFQETQDYPSTRSLLSKGSLEEFNKKLLEV